MKWNKSREGEEKKIYFNYPRLAEIKRVCPRSAAPVFHINTRKGESFGHYT